MNFTNVDSRIIALGVARMADAVANSFLIIVLPLYIASGQVSGWSFGLTEAAITGLTLGAFGIVNSVIQPLAGRISDRLGRRKAFILLGLVLLAAINLGYIWADSYIAILTVRIMQAGAVALTIVGSVALVSELSPKIGRGQNMGIYNSFRLIGFGIGPLVAGAVVTGGPYLLPGGVEITGFEASFYGAAIAAFLSAVLVNLMVSDPEDIRPSESSMNLQVLSKEPNKLFNPIFTLGVISLLMAACIALLAPIEPIVNERLNQGPFLFAVEFAAFIGTQALVQPLLGTLSDSYGRKRFIVWGLIGLIPATLLQGIVIAPWQMIVARLLQGVTAAMVFAPALALAGDLAKKGQAGSQLSILTVSFGLGIAFGQFISGFLVEYGYFVPFGAGATLAGLGLLLVYTQVDDDSTGRQLESEPSDKDEPPEFEFEARQQNYQC